MAIRAKEAGRCEVFRGQKLLRTVPYNYGATYTFEGPGKHRGEKCMLCFTFDFETVPVIWENGVKGTVRGEDLSYLKDPTPEEYEICMKGVDQNVRRALDLIANR